MTIGNLQGRAFTDPSAPLSPGTCDRCNFKWLDKDLQFQYDYRGNVLQNLKLKVCPRCYDEPQNQLRPIIVSPDPIPIKDPRPGFYAQQEGPPPAPRSAYSIIYGGNPPAPVPQYIELESGQLYLALENGQLIEME